MSRPTLTDKDVATIKGMVKRGDRQMDVATWFGINQARVSEIVMGKRWGKRCRGVQPAPVEDLPAPGPYVVVVKTEHVSSQAKAQALDELTKLLQTWLKEHSLSSNPTLTLSS